MVQMAHEYKRMDAMSTAPAQPRPSEHLAERAGADLPLPPVGSDGDLDVLRPQLPVAEGHAGQLHGQPAAAAFAARVTAGAGAMTKWDAGLSRLVHRAEMWLLPSLPG